MLDRIEQLWSQAQGDLAAANTAAQLEGVRIKYLGGSGIIKDLMAQLKSVPADQKPAFGKAANDLRQKIQEAFAARQAAVGAAAPAIAGPMIDLTEPGLPPRLGREHVISQTIDELIDVFGRMGFDVATGPEVEDEFHNFIALNIPEAHPARDPLDNFYIAPAGVAESSAINAHPAPPRGASPAANRVTPGTPSNKSQIPNPKSPILHLLRSQTSTIQVRVMEKTPPPVRVVAMGRVYRPDEHDATHYSMFHQVEGLYVDRGVSMVDLKTTLFQFVHAYFGPDAKVRLRPSFFPFTEPSAEMDVWMNVRGTWKWVEMGGCGMVDPNVFAAVGYDPEAWTGFAFGLGIERLAMRKYGITDIRWLFENDVRFLRQF